MAFCPNCGTDIPEGALNCPNCGASFAQAYGDPADHTAEFSPKDISDNKIMALCPYVFSTLGVIIALLAANKSDYAGFHVRQALKIQIVAVLGLILLIIPIAGWLAYLVLAIICLVATIIEIIQVFKGEAKEPIVIKNFSFLK